MALDGKSENGCTIKSAAYGKSGVIIRVQLIKSAEDRRIETYEKDQQYRAAVTLQLVEPWIEFGRVVHGDSAFAFVRTAITLKKYGLAYVDAAKTATKEYPKTFPSEIELTTRGDHVMLVWDESLDWKFMAVMWMDRERR